MPRNIFVLKLSATGEVMEGPLNGGFPTFAEWKSAYSDQNVGTLTPKREMNRTGFLAFSFVPKQGGEPMFFAVEESSQSEPEMPLVARLLVLPPQKAEEIQTC
ncbi:MAG: hypothetical protein NTZ87_01185 [Candidatus Nomurabacteria bacterium]|nr:hypothetical protein [Candidatus Nomurabacteria bacterium]